MDRPNFFRILVKLWSLVLFTEFIFCPENYENSKEVLSSMWCRKIYEHFLLPREQLPLPKFFDVFHLTGLKWLYVGALSLKQFVILYSASGSNNIVSSVLNHILENLNKETDKIEVNHNLSDHFIQIWIPAALFS